MTGDAFKRAIFFLYCGEVSSTADAVRVASRDFGINPRNIERMFADNKPIPHEIARTVRDQVCETLYRG